MDTGHICGPGLAAMDAEERAYARHEREMTRVFDEIRDTVAPDRINEIVGDLLSDAIHNADADICDTETAQGWVRHRMAEILAPGHADLLQALQAAVARVEIAAAEGDPILSAWLPSARAAIAKAMAGAGR
jgi:hypothetical protein